MAAERNKQKVVSKFYRLRLSDDIRRLIESIPVKLTESQVGNHVYMADGEIRTGMEKQPIRIRIAHRHGMLILMVRSKPSVNLLLPFDTPEQRKEASRKIKDALNSLLN